MTAALVLPANLPSVAHAKLPAAYEAARSAIEKCARIDECKGWADKSAAMASYAKQSKDETLFKHAVRIQARAIERCGELLRAISPAKGGRPTKETRRDAPTSLSRDAAAKAAGLSRDQKHTALRIAAVPREKFEALVESDEPPTVTELAKLGTKVKPKPLVDLGGRAPADFSAATRAIGAVHDFYRFTRSANATAVRRGLGSNERNVILPELRSIAAWATDFAASLETEDS